MSDVTDDADLVIEQQTAMAIENVLLKNKTRWSTHCDLCDEPLSDFRQPFGRCVTCQEREEKREKAGTPRTFHSADQEF